jgi:HAMP domain-containing protein
MTPDLSSATRSGALALAVAALTGGVMAWWAWDQQPSASDRLQRAQAASRAIVGDEPLARRLEIQRTANEDLAATLATLKRETGFSISERFRLASGEREPGKVFAKANARSIAFDEQLGFADLVDNFVVPAEDAQRYMALLQLTERALDVMLDAKDPVESFKISHAAPQLDGPLSRPPLLETFPLTLQVRASHQTIMWILHKFGERDAKTYPLVLRGLSIRSDNTKARDEVQQLSAEFRLAGMRFIPDDQRGDGASPRSDDPSHFRSGPRP